MSGDRLPWWVQTQRPHEAERHGLGQRELRQTLEHLHRRGDAQAWVTLKGQAAPSKIDLGLFLRTFPAA